MLTVLENAAAKGKSSVTTEYNLSKAVIQNCFYSTCTVPCVWGPLCLLYIRCTARRVGVDIGKGVTFPLVALDKIRLVDAYKIWKIT